MRRLNAASVAALLATAYLYRGISQSNEDPALQGGFDYAYEPLGFYAGFWASSIEFNAQTTNTSSIETNFYAEDGDALYLHSKLSFTLPYEFGVYTMFAYQDVNGDLTSGPAGFDYNHYAVGLTYAYSILTFDASWHDASDDYGAGDLCQALVFSVSSGC